MCSLPPEPNIKIFIVEIVIILVSKVNVCKLKHQLIWDKITIISAVELV